MAWRESPRAREVGTSCVVRKEAKSILTPTQQVRLLWALARLGCTETAVLAGLAKRLREVVGELKGKELEALYNVLTGLGMQPLYGLIHDIERALESRDEQQGEPNKAPRKKPFRRRWSRANVMMPGV